MQPLWTFTWKLLNKLKLDLGYSPDSPLQDICNTDVLGGGGADL